MLKKALSAIVLSAVMVGGFSSTAMAATPTVKGGIKTAYVKHKKALGSPTANQKCGLKGKGCYQNFQKGKIHWTSKTKGQPTFKGAIQNKWKSQKWERGALGYPVNAQRNGLKSKGSVQSFQGGAVHYSPKTGAHITKGAIKTKWKSVKWENGKLGYPTTDEYKSGSGVKQKFQGGYITWTKKSGAKVVYSKTSAPKPVDLPKPVVKVPTKFSIKGAGFGHGVGMSQYGAQGMAKEGKNSTTILQYYYNPAKVEHTKSYANSDIKVQILGGVTSSTITPKDGSLRIKSGSKTITTSKKVVVSQSGSKRVYKYDGKSFTSTSSYDTIEWQNTRAWTSGSKNTVVNVDKANGGSGTVSYRHGKILVNTLSKKLNLVNQVRMNDEYLYGLAEMPSSWDKSALASQAIAGRTYAMRNMSSLKSACACNVYDEVKSQKFIGWNKENEGTNAQWGKKWKAGVDATIARNSNKTVKTAKVIKYKGAYIDAVYSSSSNGKTQDSKDMWGGSLAYLKSRSDKWSTGSYNPNSSWTVTASQSKMNQVFGLKNIVSFSVSKNSSGYASKVIAKDKAGKTKSITGAQMRSSFGLKSTGISSIK